MLLHGAIILVVPVSMLKDDACHRDMSIGRGSELDNTTYDGRRQEDGTWTPSGRDRRSNRITFTMSEWLSNIYAHSLVPITLLENGMLAAALHVIYTRK